MAYQSWDELLRHPYFLDMWSMRPMFANAFAAAAENIKLLRQEFEFDTLHPGMSPGCLTLKPFPEKPMIYIYSDKPGDMCDIYLDNGATSEKTQVVWADLIPTVSKYLDKLKSL